jgi:hypothetical protein
MSFVHYDLVGHIDPRDPIEFGRPSRPKILRRIDPQHVHRTLKSMPTSIENLVNVDDDGCAYVIASTGSSMFLKRLADEAGAIVMNQYLAVWYPASAKAEYEAVLDELSRRWQEYCRDNPRSADP